MSKQNKVCPLMSSPENKVVCIESECMFWQRVYTSEGRLTDPDCIKVLAPQMQDGVLRV